MLLRVSAESDGSRDCLSELARIVECHYGKGLTADGCDLLELMPIDCVLIILRKKIGTNGVVFVGGRHEISIERNLMETFALKRKVRKRIYHLWMEMEIEMYKI